MKKIRYRLESDSCVNETKIFDENGDTITCINVLYENRNKILGIVRDNDKIVYIELFNNKDVCGFFENAESYCHNNRCKAMFSLAAECDQKMKDAAQYVCECSDEYTYTVYSKDTKQTSADKKEFPYWSFFQGKDANGKSSRKTVVKQLFLVLALAAAVLEHLELNAIITAILMHNGQNKILKLIMQSVCGKVSDMTIKNPKESHSRLKCHSVFDINGGTKQSDFGDTVDYITNNYIGSYLYCFNTYKSFPFDAYGNLDIKSNTFLISENFNFSAEESYEYYTAANGKNYLNEFRQFICGNIGKYNYNEMCSKYQEKIYKGTTVKKNLAERSAVIELTSRLANDCFDINIDVEAVCDLFAELNLSKAKAMSYEADDIMEKISPDLKKCIAVNVESKDNRLAFEYEKVTDLIRKKFPGVSYNDILLILESAEYVCGGHYKRSDGKERLEKYRNGNKIIEFWSDKIEWLS